MTLDEFKKQVTKEHAGQFRIENGVLIRHKTLKIGSHDLEISACPLAAIFGDEYLPAAKEAEMPSRDRDAIMDAADGYTGKLRTWMLEDPLRGGSMTTPAAARLRPGTASDGREFKGYAAATTPTSTTIGDPARHLRIPTTGGEYDSVGRGVARRGWHPPSGPSAHTRAICLMTRVCSMDHAADGMKLSRSTPGWATAWTSCLGRKLTRQRAASPAYKLNQEKDKETTMTLTRIQGHLLAQEYHRPVQRTLTVRVHPAQTPPDHMAPDG